MMLLPSTIRMILRVQQPQHPKIIDHISYICHFRSFPSIAIEASFTENFLLATNFKYQLFLRFNNNGLLLNKHFFDRGFLLFLLLQFLVFENAHYLPYLIICIVIKRDFASFSSFARAFRIRDKFVDVLVLLFIFFFFFNIASKCFQIVCSSVHSYNTSNIVLFFLQKLRYVVQPFVVRAL